MMNMTVSILSSFGPVCLRATRKLSVVLVIPYMQMYAGLFSSPSATSFVPMFLRPVMP